MKAVAGSMAEESRAGGGGREKTARERAATAVEP